MIGFVQDLRAAARAFLQRPGFATVAVVILALGIGVNTAVYSLVNGILLRPLGYPEAERVVEIWNHWEGSEQANLAVPEFCTYLEESTSFEAMAAFGRSTVNLSEGGQPEQVIGTVVSDQMFEVLGAEPAVGRGFTPDDAKPGADPVLVLSDELWRRRFGADPALVGSQILADGVPITVIGVLPPGVKLPTDYRSGSRTDLWSVLQLDPDADGAWGFHFLSALGRIRDGIDLRQAQAEMDVVVERMKERMATKTDDAVAKPSFGVRLYPALDGVVGPVRPALYILLGAVMLVLAIACANVANLMLVRGELRNRELALRSALGASRGRLVSQLLAESVLLAGVGGAAGWLFGAWALQLFISVTPPGIPRLGSVELDTSVLAFTAVVTLSTAFLFGLLPAVQLSKTDLTAWLKTGEHGGTAGRERQRLRSLLVVVETALAVVLVLCAGLLMRSFWKLRGVDPGYQIEHILTLQLDLPSSAYAEASDVAGFYRTLGLRLESLPDVESVGGVTHLPLAAPRGDWNFYPEDRTLVPGEPKPRGDWQVVTPGYFETMGIAVLQGRSITDRDGVDAPPVLMINRSLAERYWPSSSPIGQRVRLGGYDDNPYATIVGVVADIRHDGLIRDPVPELYITHAQADHIMGVGVFRSMSLVLRTGGDPEFLAGAVRSEVAALDRDLPVANIRTMEEIRVGSLAVSRFSMVLLLSFALLALVLGGVGIFGVISFLVAHRTREIGIRIALGAGRGAVLGMVVGQGVRLAAIGLVVGLVGALGVARLLSSLLYGVLPSDPATFALVTLVLGLVAFTASYLPARRAASIDPIQALREE